MEQRIIYVDELSELVGEPIEVFLSRLDLKLPSIIEAEPVRHGHWVDKKYGVTFGNHRYPFRPYGKCSECGKVSSDAGAYCTNCGAIMDA